MLTLPAYWLIGLAASSGNPSKPTSHPAPTAVEVTRFGAFDDGLHVELTPTSLRASIEQGERTFTVELRTLAIARGDDVRALIASPAAGSDARRERQLDGLTEWYVPQRAGLEHGWTLSARPQGDSASPVWILLEFAGDLSPRISEDGRAAWLVDHEAQLRMRYDGLKAWDADGRPVEVRLASSPLGFGVRVHDMGAHYPITIDPVLSGPIVTLDGPTLSAFFGQVVSTAGDVNGDGYSDVLITQPFYVNGQVEEGRALVYHGSASGLALTPNWDVESNQANARFGEGAGTAGDVNGDGYDDVIIGAPQWDEPGGGANHGRVYVFLGSATGLSTSPSWTWTAGQAGAAVGFRCATAGDVNGDGRDDVLVGAQYHDSTIPPLVDNGAAFVFFGTASGVLAATPAWERYGSATLDFQVMSVATAGDLDADGYADIAVGSPHDGISDSGRVFVHRGSPTGPVNPAIEINPVPPGGSWTFGISVAGAGDVNGDGFADLIVGAGVADQGPNDCGKAYIFLGKSVANGTIATTEVWSINGGQTNGYLGHSVAPAGDVNGDGFADFVYGEPAWVAGAPGIAYIGLGQSTVPFPTETIVTGPGGVDGLGFSVCTAGDVNGDGFGDVLIGAPYHNSNQGRVRLYYGQPKADSTRFEVTLGASSSTAAAGSALAMGDVDSDGYADLLVGQPNYMNPAAQEGIVHYYRGRASAISTSPTWSQEGVVAGAHFGHSIAYLGDVDGDGYGDILVGVPDATDGQSAEGKVVLYLGTSTGPSSTGQEFQSNVAGARLGASVAAAGDVNGDGLADAVVGAPGTWLSLADAGSAHVFLGRRSPPGLVQVSPAISPALAGAEFGRAVAGAADLNVDGYSDVVVGAPGLTSGQAREGAIYVYRGSPAGLETTPDVVVQGNTPGAEFGWAVSSAGDVNEDHFADILVGAPGWESLTKGGFAFVYRGQSGATILNATPLHSIHFGQPGARTGAAVAYAGDLNGDYHADALIGVPSWNAAENDGGRIAVFFGTGSVLAGASTLPASSALLSIPGDDQVSGSGAANALAGTSLAAGGDMHGHGFGDFAAGAPGAGGGDGNAYLYWGGDGATANRFNLDQRRLDDTRAIGILGSSDTSNSFGASATVAGFHAPTGNLHPGTLAGRESLQIVWEAKPLGTNFDGTGLGSLPFMDSGDNSLPVVRTPIPVTGLAQNLNYHWRMRFELRNPYMPHSRWLLLQGNSQQEKKVGTSKDCDNDGIADALEIQNMTEDDCNGNLIPDNCDVVFFMTHPDCNNNTLPDSCDLFLNDCNGNLVPDECELPGPFCATCVDCNINQTIDSCDVTIGMMADTNGDLLPDPCQTGGIFAFCFGDGSATSCPCGNVGTSGNGCPSSLFPGGANLAWSGVPRVAFDNFKLLGSNMPNSSALYFQANAQQNGGLGSVFGDGLRCANGSVVRLGTKINAGGISQYPMPGDLPISIRGAVPLPGATRTYQCWYRNAAVFCTASTFNLTNGVQALWIP